MNKQLYFAALVIAMAAATPAQAGWFSFGGIMGTGAGDTGFGTNQVAGQPQKQTAQNPNKLQISQHLASADKKDNGSFVTPDKSISSK